MNLNQSDVRTCNHYVQNLYFVALLFSTWMYHHKKNLPLAPIYSSYFQEQNVSPKKLFNCYNALSSICFSKILNFFILLFATFYIYKQQ